MHGETAAEALRLRAVLRDVVVLSAIPAAWIGSEPPFVAAELADALVGLLQLDFAFVRLSDAGGAGAAEVTRGDAWQRFPEWLEGHVAGRATLPRKVVVPDIGDDSARRRGFAVPVGVNGDGGLVAAASQRSDFPTPTEQLLLSLAANHAAGAFQSARIIRERKNAEEALRKARNELEAKVAERTAELQVVNDELNSLRRVATLVAEGVPPADLFAVVAEAVARVVKVPLVSVTRYELDGTATECASFSPNGSPFPVGKRISLDGTNVFQLVHESCRPARIDDYANLEGQIADVVRRSGIRSTVGVPIVVASHVWGAMVVSTTEPEPLPEGTEARLADFTELLATAVENAESREALGRLADEQAALRRVATLVARGVRPSEIFSAVSEEVGHLFGTNMAAVTRFEDEGPALVFVGVSREVEGVIPVGTRLQLEAAMASTDVYYTGRSGRRDVVDPSPDTGPGAAAGRVLGGVSTVASPIIAEGRLWGTATVTATETLLPDAEERLEKFAELVATAISNAETRSELDASRRRIVAASDEARRRIERDLHDGTQQRLVSLGLAVRATEANVDPALRSELSTIAAGLTDAVAELQELSRGIHPAILSQGGLGPALRSLARRSTLPVALEIAIDTRLPEPVEVAAYYVASEALANTTKHARASRMDLTLEPSHAGLRLSIRDDGIGGADPAHGSGLLGLVDRVEALGGSIGVHSPPGGGTQITAELPLELSEGRPKP
ncbi:MAG TPA: GAF domain-containing protein [Jatrophihabitans sp.]|nr:GAF domain-containing protein [Jatrophihabitans sp.]